MLSCVWFFVTPWTAPHQAPLSVAFSRQEYWNGLPFPSSGDLPNPGIKLNLLHCRQILYHLNHQGNPNIFLKSTIVQHSSWHTGAGIEWTGKKRYWLEDWEEMGDGRAEGSSAIGDRVKESVSHIWLFATRGCSLPGSSVHGLSQARILEWVAISSSRVSSWCRV